MIYIVGSIVCSLLVSVLLRLAPGRRIDLRQAIGWNYVAAAVLCLLTLHPERSQLAAHSMPWPSLLALGVLLPSIFLAQGQSIRQAGIARTEVAQRLALLLSLAAAFGLYHEVFNGQKALALVLGAVAVLCMLRRDVAERSAAGAARLPLLLVLVGFAAIDVLFKQVALAGAPFVASLWLSFVLAAGLCLLAALWLGLRGQLQPAWRHLAAGILLGLANFANIYCYIHAHIALSAHPAQVFAGTNIGAVVLATVLGASVFGERWSRWRLAGIALAVLALGLLTHAQASS